MRSTNPRRYLIFFSSNFPSNAVRIMSGDPFLTRVLTIFINTYIFGGREEGRKEAMKRGREEGRNGGREEGRKGGSEEVRKGGREEGRKEGRKDQALIGVPFNRAPTKLQ